MSNSQGTAVQILSIDPDEMPFTVHLSPKLLMIILRLAEAGKIGLSTREPIPGLVAGVFSLRDHGVEIETRYNFGGDKPAIDTGRYIMHSLAMVEEFG